MSCVRLGGQFLEHEARQMGSKTHFGYLIGVLVGFPGGLSAFVACIKYIAPKMANPSSKLRKKKFGPIFRLPIFGLSEKKCRPPVSNMVYQTQFKRCKRPCGLAGVEFRCCFRAEKIIKVKKSHLWLQNGPHTAGAKKKWWF